jgi:hypothetical protein
MIIVAQNSNPHPLNILSHLYPYYCLSTLSILLGLYPYPTSCSYPIQFLFIGEI